VWVVVTAGVRMSGWGGRRACFGVRVRLVDEGERAGEGRGRIQSDERRKGEHATSRPIRSNPRSHPKTIVVPPPPFKGEGLQQPVVGREQREPCVKRRWRGRTRAGSAGARRRSHAHQLFTRSICRRRSSDQEAASQASSERSASPSAHDPDTCRARRRARRRGQKYRPAHRRLRGVMAQALRRVRSRPLPS
jgi:hypothetical protein